jgi:hypothetical protein
VSYNVVSGTVCWGDTVDEVAVTLVLSLCVVLCFEIATNRYWGMGYGIGYMRGGVIANES